MFARDKLLVVSYEHHARKCCAHLPCCAEGNIRRFPSTWSDIVGSSPRLTILAVLLFQASKHPSAFEIAKVVSIAESTVQIAYANLKTEARTLVPAWFASPEDIVRLPDY